MIKKIMYLFLFAVFTAGTLFAQENEPVSDKSSFSDITKSVSSPVFDVKTGHFYDVLTLLFRSIAPEDAQSAITLKESLEIAEKQSMSLANARSKVNELYYRVDEVKSAKNIIVGASGSATYSGPVQTIEFDGNTMALGSYMNWSSAVTAQYLISNFGLFEDARKMAWLSYLNAKLDEERLTEDLYSSVITSYMGALETTGLYVVAENAVELRKQQMEIAKAKYEEGISPKYDMLTTQVNLKEAEQSLITSRRAMELNKASLKNIMGLPQTQFLTVVRPIYFAKNDLDLPSAIDMAYKNRIEMAQMDMTVEIAKTNCDLAAQGKNPNLLFNGRYSLQSVGFGSSPYGWSTGFSLNIPIFDGGQTKAQLSQAKEVLKQSEYAREQTRRDIDLQVADALLRIDESRKKLQTAEASLDMARESYEISFVRYKESVGTFLELDSATVSYLQALVTLSSAYCEYERSQSNLLYSTGLLVKEVQKNVLSQSK